MNVQTSQDSEKFIPPNSPGSLLMAENFGEDGEHLKAFWDENGTATIEKASQYSEVGKFHIWLLIVCLIGYTTTSTVPYTLIKFSNAIQCDYHLITEDKKAINDIVYVCMLLGGVAWSLLADTLSRKWTLVFALLVYSMATYGLTTVSTFTYFGFCRGIGAFCLSGIRCTIITFIAEFQVRIYRGTMICCLQLAWVFGMITIPYLAYPWKTRMSLAAIPPLIAMVGFIFFPDPPRFLFSRGRQKAALRGYQMMHGINTGKFRSDFPIKQLKDNISVAEIKRTSIMKQYIPPYLEPKFVCIPLLMLSQFVMLFSYYTLALWFPEMVPRSDAFFPLKEAEDIPQDCKIRMYRSASEENFEKYKLFKERNTSFTATKNLSSMRMDHPEDPCDIKNKKFFHKSGIMDSLALMPSIIWVVVKIDTIGRKFFLTFSHVVTGCLAFASYFMHSSSKALLFSSLFDAFTVMSITTAHCLAVELFPTRVRVLGVALVLGAGQLGAVLADIGGALSFGLTCVVTIASIALALAITGMLIMILPDTTGVCLR